MLNKNTDRKEKKKSNEAVKLHRVWLSPNDHSPGHWALIFQQGEYFTNKDMALFYE